MTARELKILKGGRDAGNLSGMNADRFQLAEATNTRLMGVLGVKVCWKLKSGDLFYQFFHLDSESYGIDGYESLMNPLAHEVDYIAKHMMGGLGGIFKTISYEELIYLLKWFHALNLKHDEALPDGSDEFEDLLKIPVDLSPLESEHLMKKICEPIESEIHGIHYFLMRLIGGDVTAAKFLTAEECQPEEDLEIREGMLLRNEAVCENRFRKRKLCRAESLIDAETGYFLVHTELEVVKDSGGYKIRSAKKTREMRISNIEAAFLLKKPEHILVYDIENLEAFLMTLKIENPCMMNNMHEGGVLFTRFNPHNNHVKEPVYYLNGDVHSLYYITRAEQLVVASFSRNKLREAFEILKSDIYQDMLVFEEEILLQEPVFYEFVNSGMENIYDFFDSNGIG